MSSLQLPLAFTLLLVSQFAVASASGAEANRPPNVILVFTDDQGYQDLGCFGSPLIATPNLDRMASEGIKFTDFYSANSVCSPSRAALLTGCYPTRVSIPGVLFPRHDIGLNPTETTIAEMLKDRGYATACIGKWHLGHKPAFLPTRQGFDSYFGIPYSNDMTIDPTASLAAEVVLREGVTRESIATETPKKNWVPLMRDTNVVEYPCDQSTLTKRYTEEALTFIRKNKDQPFFLYLPHTMPHIPLYASEAFAGSSKRGPYGDTIEEIDWSVGQLLAELKSLGLDEQTLVVYTSDNGPWNLSDGRGGSAAPLRGHKFQTYEGGMRVPCLMRWPGKIVAGQECNEVAATIDLLPTIANLSGAKLPAEQVIDGRDITPLLEAPKDAKSPHAEFFYYRGTNLEAVRSGDWKLRRTKRPPPGKNRNKKSNTANNLNNANDGKQSERPVAKGPASLQIELYDLASDISETTNLDQDNPQVVAGLLEKMNAFDQQLKANQRPAGRWTTEKE